MFVTALCVECGQTHNGKPCENDFKIQSSGKTTTFISSQWAERVVCSRCGTHPYDKMTVSNE